MSILIKNATVVTQNERRQILEKANVLIAENRISAIGKKAKEKTDVVIDAKDKILMPGLINGHSHAAMALFRSSGDDLPLQQWLSEKIWPMEKKFKPADVYAGALLACAEMIKGGTTCFNDHYFHMDKVAEAAEKAGVRACLGYSMIDFNNKEKRDSELKEEVRFIESAARRSGLITSSVCPHAPYTCSTELLQASESLAARYMLTVHMHLSETDKEVRSCFRQKHKRPVKYLDALGLVNRRLVAAHGVWLSGEEIRILGKKRANVVHCPVSNLKLVSGRIAPVSELMAAGANVCLGTDGPGSNDGHNMWETIKLTALLQKYKYMSARKLNAQTALDLATLNGARAIGVNAGTVAEGKLADLILLDRNALNLRPVHNIVGSLVYAAQPDNVRDVIINGKLVLRDGKFTQLKEEEIIRQVEKAKERVFR